MQVFLSHATRDATEVALIRDQLRAAGVGVYLAEYDQMAGGRISDKVERAIRQSDILVVLFSKAGFGSIYVQQEVGLAVGAKKLVIPLVSVELAQNTDLGILAGVEYIVLDSNNPAGAMSELERRCSALQRQQSDQDLMILGALVLTVFALVYVNSTS